MPSVKLYNGTALIRTALEVKGIHFVEPKEEPPYGGAVDAPILEDDGDYPGGEAAILGYIDRKYPFPPFFPQSPTEYARVQTLYDALRSKGAGVEQLRDAMLDTVRFNCGFLHGETPRITDVYLVSILLDETCPELKRYVSRVRACGAGDPDKVGAA